MTARKTATKLKRPASARTQRTSAKRSSAKAAASPKAEATEEAPKPASAKVEPPKAEPKPAPAPAAAPAPEPAADAKTPEAEPQKSAPKPVAQTAAQESEKIKQGMKTMANTTEKMTDQTSKMVGDMSERAKAATQKTSQMMTQAGEMSRGNVEAFVEAGKIGAEGFQDMSRDNMEFAKKNFEDASGAMKDFTSVKSPTELFQLQGEFARKNFDVMVEQASKNTEKMVKLFGDMFQPISNRMAEASDKMKIDA